MHAGLFILLLLVVMPGILCLVLGMLTAIISGLHVLLKIFLLVSPRQVCSGDYTLEYTCLEINPLQLLRELYLCNLVF